LKQKAHRILVWFVDGRQKNWQKVRKRNDFRTRDEGGGGECGAIEDGEVWRFRGYNLVAGRHSSAARAPWEAAAVHAAQEMRIQLVKWDHYIQQESLAAAAAVDEVEALAAWCAWARSATHPHARRRQSSNCITQTINHRQHSRQHHNNIQLSQTFPINTTNYHHSFLQLFKNFPRLILRICNKQNLNTPAVVQRMRRADKLDHAANAVSTEHKQKQDAKHKKPSGLKNGKPRAWARFSCGLQPNATPSSWL
jgi:hypothetical protein